MGDPRPREVRQAAARLAKAAALAVSLSLLSTPPATGGPVRESIRGGAGKPVVELRDNRKLNQDADATYEKYVDGLYVLRLFRTASADGSYQIDVWNLLVGPGRETTEFNLPGAAVLLLRAGNARVVVNRERKSDLEMGATLVVPEKSRIRISNPDPERPVTVRATLLSGIE